MPDDRIVLDSSSFKALASETRVLILKELDKKRSTASEIAKALGISVQTASEHLENMRVADLVERAESGRKWVYFSLTEKGKAVLHPESKRIWVLLSLAFLLFASYAFFNWQQPVAQQFGESAPLLDAGGPDALARDSGLAQSPAVPAPPDAGMKIAAERDYANETNETNSTETV